MKVLRLLPNAVLTLVGETTFDASLTGPFIT